MDWPLYAQQHVDNYEVPNYEFSAVVYNDTYKFVPLDPLSFSAKVCWDEQETFCCLADYNSNVFDTEDVFSLGIFSGNHTKDGSVLGSFYIEMCTIMKCNPRDIENTCDHELIKDYEYLSTSNTFFSKLELSGSFSSTTRVFPELLFNDTQLLPDQVIFKLLQEKIFCQRWKLQMTEFFVFVTPEISTIQSSPCLSLVEGTKIKILLAWSVFFPHLKRYEADSAQPDHFCPGEED